jgi:hypothetical protein
VRCFRGRRCANLVLLDLEEDAPTGAVLMVEYTCGSCGTRYRSAILFGRAGSWTQQSREQVPG